MHTFISPLGYDTRRVTQPVVQTGLSPADEIVLVRPATESDSERASQAIADVEQLLHQLEPEATCTVERVTTASFGETVMEWCDIVTTPDADRDVVVSLGGGARDILLPLVTATLLVAPRVDQTLFYSDLDNSVQQWHLPALTREIPARATPTLGALIDTDGWQTLSELAADTDQSKSTVIRHVQDLTAAGLAESRDAGKAKEVRPTLTGTLRWRARTLNE